MGPVGPQGAIGFPGPAGISPTVAVGEVFTGEPGSNAAVIDVGGAPDHVFNFVIPRGATGATGPSGSFGAYGGAAGSGIRQIAAEAGEYVPLQLDIPLPAREMAVAGGGLQIQQAGDYMVSYSLLLRADGPAWVSAGIRRNGEMQTVTVTKQALTANTVDGAAYEARLTGVSLIRLETGDTVGLAVSASGAEPGNFAWSVGQDADAVLVLRQIG